MTPDEIDMLSSLMKQSRTYLEYGAGGSTQLAVATEELQKIVSVESDKSWHNHLLSNEEVKNAIQSGRLNLKLINIGETGESGRPEGIERKEFWPMYSSFPFFEENTAYDMVLIDGRFRYACAYMCMLNCPKARILIHDYSRPAYWSLEDYCDLVGKVDTLAELRLREGISRELILNKYKNFCFNHKDMNLRERLRQRGYQIRGKIGIGRILRKIIK